MKSRFLDEFKLSWPELGQPLEFDVPSEVLIEVFWVRLMCGPAAVARRDKEGFVRDDTVDEVHAL